MEDKSWSGILIILECREGRILEVSFELIGKAVNLAEEKKEKMIAVGIGEDIAKIEKQLQGSPLDEIYLYQTKEEFQADRYEEGILDCISQVRPSILLVGGTNQGRALASRVAVSCKTGVTADCTELYFDEKGNLVQTRPAFGGNIMASIVTEKSRPQIATVRPGIFLSPQLDAAHEMKIHRKNLEGKEKKAVIFDKIVKIEEKGIDQQRILVAAGRGVQKKEDLKMFHQLAELLGGSFASSRALVEKGWTKPREQIGLSGITVAPEYLLAFGISGTIQFITGMKHTKNIIAVNNDPNADIFQIAHYPICADLYDVVPAIMERLKKERR